MQKAHLRVPAQAALSLALCLSALACTDQASTKITDSAAVAVRVRVVAPASAKGLAQQQTTWDSLVVRVILADGDTVRHALAVTPADAIVADTLTGVPAGDGALVEAATVNTQGVTIHAAPAQTVDIVPGELVEVSFWLNPVRSSVYIELTDVPTLVDSVQACFQTAQDTFCTCVARSARVTMLAIDDIPDGASGTLVLAGVGVAGDTLYLSTLSLTVYADRAETVWAVFSESPGDITVDVSLVEPLPTLVAASMDGSSGAGAETGALLITEIMYMANGSEYLELYNPSAHDTLFDTIAVERDGTLRWLYNVAIGAHGYFVVGRCDSAWVDTVLTFLDLSSTSGNWLTVRDARLRVLDWVGYAVKSNDLGWPHIVSARASIALDSACADPACNNFGSHWRESTTAIDGGADMMGTPGGPGF
jgi:hypothetical protein